MKEHPSGISVAEECLSSPVLVRQPFSGRHKGTEWSSVIRSILLPLLLLASSCNMNWSSLANHSLGFASSTTAGFLTTSGRSPPPPPPPPPPYPASVFFVDLSSCCSLSGEIGCTATAKSQFSRYHGVVVATGRSLWALLVMGLIGWQILTIIDLCFHFFDHTPPPPESGSDPEVGAPHCNDRV